jgi:hypothetical protein
MLNGLILIKHKCLFVKKQRLTYLNYELIHLKHRDSFVKVVLRVRS